MSIPLPRAFLLALIFLVGNFLIQMVLSIPSASAGGTGPDGASAYPAYKLLLSLAFVLPLWAVFLIQRRKPGPFLFPGVGTQTDHGRTGGIRARFVTAVLLFIAVVPLLAGAMLVLGTELLNYTREWLGAEESYRLMMRFVGPGGSNLDMLGAYITICLVGPVCEELLFRGLLLRGMEDHYRRKNGAALAIAAQAILFALVHMNQFQFLYALGAGIILGYLARLGGGILLPVCVHIVINTTQITVLYFFPRTPYFGYEGMGVIRHLPPWAIIAAAIVLGLSIVAMRFASSRVPSAQE